jgi:hypothetical protein
VEVRAQAVKEIAAGMAPASAGEPRAAAVVHRLWVQTAFATERRQDGVAVLAVQEPQAASRAVASLAQGAVAAVVAVCLAPLVQVVLEEAVQARTAVPDQRVQ